MSSTRGYRAVSTHGTTEAYSTRQYAAPTLPTPSTSSLMMTDTSSVLSASSLVANGAIVLDTLPRTVPALMSLAAPVSKLATVPVTAEPTDASIVIYGTVLVA